MKNRKPSFLYLFIVIMLLWIALALAFIVNYPIVEGLSITQFSFFVGLSLLIAVLTTVIITILFARQREKLIDQTESIVQSAYLARKNKGDFLARMSHELRTPLNGIIGLAEALSEEESDTEKLKSLSAIRQSGTSLIHLINEILDLSKIEAGRMLLHTSEVNVSDLVNESASTINVGCKKKGLELKVHVDPEIPAIINTDGHKLVRALINLLGNAVKFTNKGEIAVNVAPYKESRKGKIIFTVSDSGRGIPEKSREIIFEKYMHANEDDDVRSDGTGLGLPIAKGLVELMGGEIWVESKEGGGTAFNFTISY